MTATAKSSVDLAGLDKAALLQMYETMRLIRTFEDTVHELTAKGKCPGGVHLSAGQEAVAAGVMAALRPDDYIGATHRGHHHCLAKGLDVKGMLAELYGKSTGICKGKGGSMHLADPAKGMLGNNAIVGGGIPILTGAALSAQYRQSGQVAVSFFGDGAVNQGTFHESINMAALLCLPIVYVCENNLYACTMASCYSVTGESIARRADAYGIPSEVVDGQNVVEVYRAAKAAVERARSGGGPTLLEIKTYRYYGHYEGDNMRYRTREEENEQRQRDPLKIFAEAIAPGAGIQPAQMAEVDERIRAGMQEAVDFAEQSPWPELSDGLADVYVA